MGVPVSVGVGGRTEGGFEVRLGVMVGVMGGGFFVSVGGGGFVGGAGEVTLKAAAVQYCVLVPNPSQAMIL